MSSGQSFQERIGKTIRVREYSYDNRRGCLCVIYCIFMVCGGRCKVQSSKVIVSAIFCERVCAGFCLGLFRDLDTCDDTVEPCTPDLVLLPKMIRRLKMIHQVTSFTVTTNLTLVNLCYCFFISLLMSSCDLINYDDY